MSAEKKEVKAEVKTEAKLENVQANQVNEPEVVAEVTETEPSVVVNNTLFAEKVLLDKTIRRSVYGAMALGVVPSVGLNVVALTALNLNLTRKLSKLYGVEFKEGVARKLITSVAGMSLSLVGAPVVEGLILSALPVVGIPAALCSIPLVFGGCTYAVGCMFAKHFERGGNFVQIDAEEMKGYFAEAFKNSREWIADKVRGKEAAASL